MYCTGMSGVDAHLSLCSSAFALSSLMLMLPFLSTPMGTMRMPGAQ